MNHKRRTNKIRKAISIVLVAAILLSMLCGCAPLAPSSSNDPSVSVTVIDGDKEPGAKETSMAEEAAQENASITSMVYSAVAFDLESKGFDAHDSVAVSSDDSYAQLGMGYYNSDFQLFDNPDYASVGFLTVVGQGEDVIPIPEDSEYIAVEPVDGKFNDKDSLYHILTYSCEDISSGHFVSVKRSDG